MLTRGCIAFFLLFFAVDAGAQTTKTLSGRWSASTMRTAWTADPWGTACGPKPAATSEPGGIVTITQQGKEFSIVGLGRTFASSSCWENIPSARTVSHSASERAIRTVCQSPVGDPRRSAVTTTMTATDDRIDFVEVGQFEYSIGNDTCHAVMRRNRTYSLVEREGESRPVPSAVPAVPAAAPMPESVESTPPDLAAKPSRDCGSPGPAQRIEVSPARKLLRAGEQYSFRVRVLDKGGCVLERQVSWNKLTANAPVEVTPQGMIKVNPLASEGPVALVASVQELKVAVTVDVVSEARYQELLVAGTFDAAGETKEAAVTTTVSSTLGTKATVLEAAAQKRRILFVWTIGGLAVSLALAALWLTLSRRKPLTTSTDFDETEPSPGVQPKDDRMAGAAKGASVLVCPTCHEEYPVDQKFCAIDGNRLIEIPSQVSLTGAEGGVCPVCRHGFDPGVTRCPNHDEELVPAAAIIQRPAAAASAGRRICPVCGSLYGPETQFCGNDGATLVPIN